MSKIHNKLENNFTQIPNTILLDTRVSALAFKIYSYICFRIGSSPEWEFYNKEVGGHFKEKIKSFMKAKKELEELGYLRKIRQNKNLSGKWAGCDYVIYKNPYENNETKPIYQIGTSVIGTSVIGTSQKGCTNNIDNNNIDIKKIDSIQPTSFSKKGDLFEMPFFKEISSIYLKIINIPPHESGYFINAMKDKNKKIWLKLLKDYPLPKVKSVLESICLRHYKDEEAELKPISYFTDSVIEEIQSSETNEKRNAAFLVEKVKEEERTHAELQERHGEGYKETFLDMFNSKLEETIKEDIKAVKMTFQRAGQITLKITNPDLLNYVYNQFDLLLKKIYKKFFGDSLSIWGFIRE